jgi:hypothetical protein
MTATPYESNRRWAWLAAIAILVAAFFWPASGSSLAQRFYASLRIAKPKAVTAGIAAPPGTNPNRALQTLVGAMLAESVTVALDEPDESVPDTATANRRAGFAMVLPGGRTDGPVLSVVGAHAIRMRVNRAQLRTTLVQAGMGRTALAPAIDGTSATFTTPRAIRAQFGHCPEPVANTLTAQLQGPPPTSTDYGTCVVLIESAPSTAEIPTGLDVGQLVEIALQLSGMSPIQVQAFQARFDWQSALSLVLPRFMRSYDTVQVAGARGMLLNTAGRRGPTYTLLWESDGRVYTLTGYGSAAEALPLARSLR